MRHTISIIVFFVFFSLTLQVFSQEGFDVIRLAERKYEKGQLNGALKLLSKAEKMDYGFCGNAWFEADNAINSLRYKIYMDKKDYEMARNSLYYLFPSNRVDSIIIRTYQMEYGKDSLSNMIDSSLVNTRIECGKYHCYAIVSLTNGNVIRMRTRFSLDNITNEKKKANIWVTWFKKSEIYRLVKGKD